MTVLQYFPRYFASRAIVVYIMALAAVSLSFVDHVLPLRWVLFGSVAVLGFFGLCYAATKHWRPIPEKRFIRNVFWAALFLRLGWVVFSYFFYQAHTGIPFEFETGDALAYHEDAAWLAGVSRSRVMDYLFFSRLGISDSGYSLYLTLVYKIFGTGVLFPRILKAIFSAATCILVYRLALRNFGEATARITAVFCTFMPNLILYCGLHLKETEMLFIVSLFLERADNMLRGRRFSIGSILGVVSLGMILFAFRTALGVIVFTALFVAMVLSGKRTLSLWKKVGIGLVAVAMVFTSVGVQIRSEIKQLWAEKDTNQERSMVSRAMREGGNALAAYASSAVFAPLILTVPFPSMVHTGQDNQELIHGGNFAKNILSGFAILALICMLLNRDWRQCLLPLFYTGGYLMVLAFSAFAHSERFHLPALPFVLMLAAYGVTHFENKHKRLYVIWLVVIFLACLAWNWFKLRGRGVV